MTTKSFNFKKRILRLDCLTRYYFPNANVLIFKNCIVWLTNKLTDQKTKKPERSVYILKTTTHKKAFLLHAEKIVYLPECNWHNWLLICKNPTSNHESNHYGWITTWNIKTKSNRINWDETLSTSKTRGSGEVLRQYRQSRIHKRKKPNELIMKVKMQN